MYRPFDLPIRPRGLRLTRSSAGVIVTRRYKDRPAAPQPYGCRG